jgi:hypothetical protein
MTNQWVSLIEDINCETNKNNLTIDQKRKKLLDNSVDEVDILKALFEADKGLEEILILKTSRGKVVLTASDNSILDYDMFESKIVKIEKVEVISHRNVQWDAFK